MRVLGRVERFRDRLQLEVRTLEAADADPAELAPPMRRDADELDGFLEFLAARDRASRARAGRRRVVADASCGGDARAAGRGRRTTPTRAGCSSTRSASRRSPRDRAAPSAAARRPAARRGAAARPRARARARRGARVPADRGGAPARPRPPRPAADRGARRASTRTCAPSSCTRSPSHHDRARPARPRLRALPREPARRRRRDAAGRRLTRDAAIALALGASVSGASATSSAG